MSMYFALNDPEATFEVTLPVFHMNGNDPKALAKQYYHAVLALEGLEKMFYSIEFHARDYYVEPQAWDKAVKQREEIKFKIRDIKNYLELHAAHCFEASR